MTASTRFHGLGASLRAVFDWIFPKQYLKLNDAVLATLSDDRIRIADIGGAMGADARWSPVSPISQFMFFEPDARSQNDLGNQSSDHPVSDIVVPHGLAREDGERTLHLTKGPFASSLYKPNETTLRDFPVWDWYKPVEDITVSLRTLDGVLSEHDTSWSPDFIKIDIEGADLEVLQSGTNALSSSFGVQIEVSFMDRNVGSPGYGTVDEWIRAQGFVPHLLLREHWVRSNGLHSANSAAQIAWGDAVYFRPMDWIIEKLKASPETAERNLSAYVSILLVYGRHDYSHDIVSQAAGAGCISPANRAALIESIKASMRSSTSLIVRGTLATIMSGLIALPLSVLGRRFRKLGNGLIKQQAGPLFEHLSTLTRRAGLEASCITDRS